MRVVVVAKQSAYGRYVEEEGDSRVRELLERRDPVVRRWQSAHDAHVRSLEATLALLEHLGVHVLLIRRPSDSFDAADAALVVSVGGDGTLLAASHNVAAVPILGINSDPKSSVGFFCAGHRGNLGRLVPRALEGKLPGVRLERMEVRLNGRIRSRRVLNDVLYSHASPAHTSTYILRVGRAVETQCSSGIWIGPAAGSTGAQSSAGGKVLPLGSKRLQLVVREPYVPDGKPPALRRALVEPGQAVTIRSKMQDGAMYLDGPYKQVRLRLGDVATFRVSREPLRLVGITARRTKID